jgi:hypothetical protein
MDVVNLIHDETTEAIPFLVDKAKNAFKDLPLGNHELGLLLIIIGAGLLDWEPGNGIA